MTQDMIFKLLREYLPHAYLNSPAAALRFAEALLARQPAAIGKEAVTPVRIADAERAAYEVSGHRAGEKWTKAFAEALLATPLAKEASKPAPSVEQDERGALVDAIEAIPVPDARCLSNPEAFEQGFNFAISAAAELARAASTSANVAQGAEAVALTEDQRQILEWCKNYHFRRCTEGDFHLRIVAVVNQILAAPPAQTATTDDARDAARWRWFTQNYGALNLHEKFAGNTPRVFTHGLKGRSWGEITRTIDAALTAAQSASGDTK